MPSLELTQSALQQMLIRAERLHDEHRPTGLGETKHILQAIEKVKAVQTEASRDRNLSDVGRKDRVVNVAKQAIDLSSLKKSREHTAAAMQRLTAELFSIPPRREGQEVLERMDEAEIRQATKGKNQGEIISMFTNAVSSGNHTAARALSRGPLGSLVPADVEARILREHAAAAKPEQFTRLESLGALDEHLAAVETLATRLLHEFTSNGKG